MPKKTSARLLADGLSFAVVVARFNSFITDKLLEGCIDSVVRHGGSDKDIHVVYVPGAFEIPVVAQKLAKSKDYDAVICLGCVIRGATPHFDYVAGESAKGVAAAALASGKPVINGIITTDTIEQAIERAGCKMGNKGWDAAVTAIEMANLMKEIG